jgi:hypothetical protein
MSHAALCGVKQLLQPNCLHCCANVLCSDLLYHICYTGGLGKTTLAITVYQHMLAVQPQFKHACKHMHIQSDHSSTTATTLQHQALHAWLQLHSGAVLLLLDNLQDSSQLDTLLGNSVLMQGSFVLITSRSTMTNSSAINSSVYEYTMPRLAPNDALTVFRHYTQCDHTSAWQKAQVTEVILNRYIHYERYTAPATLSNIAF